MAVLEKETVKKVIFNQSYIDELQEQLDSLTETNASDSAITELQQKIEWALDFTDTIESFNDIEKPSKAVCKTLSGLELPVKDLIIF